MKPEVVQKRFLALQVCVPENFTDQEVLAFAEGASPCGTEHGWTIRKEGNPNLAGDPERNPCQERKHCVHITLDA